MNEKEGMDDLAARVDALVPGVGAFVRAVEAHDQEVERVRVLLEHATEGVHPGVVLQALSGESVAAWWSS